MKNKLTHLNDHLFAQLERVSDEDLTPDQLTTELNRSKAVTSIAKEIVSNARLALDAEVKVGDSIVKINVPEMLKSK
jgi:hypothetical protein